MIEGKIPVLETAEAATFFTGHPRRLRPCGTRRFALLWQSFAGHTDPTGTPSPVSGKPTPAECHSLFQLPNEVGLFNASKHTIPRTPVTASSMTPSIQPRTIVVLTFVGFLVVCGLNFWVFRTFVGRNYLEWYANTGPIIALATVTFGSAWGGLDKNPALLSTNPLNYLGAWLQVAGLPLMAIGTHLRSSSQRKSLGFEVLLVVALSIALLVAMLGWFILVVPVQYFLFLLVGSLSRIALSSSAHITARMRSGQVSLSTHYGRPPSTGPEESEPTQSDDREWDASMRDEPFTLANAFGAVLLFVLSMLWR